MNPTLTFMGTILPKSGIQNQKFKNEVIFLVISIAKSEGGKIKTKLKIARFFLYLIFGMYPKIDMDD
jgi:hypothetical protein